MVEGLVDRMVEKKVEISELRPIYSGTSKNYFLKYNGNSAVLKTSGYIAPLGNIERYLRKKFESHLPVVLNQIEEAPFSDIIELESKVLRNWNKTKVNSPKLFYSDGKEAIVMECIEGLDYKTLVQKGEYSKQHHDRLLETLGQLEEAALSSRNIYSIHNDFHLGNFMYDNKRDRCVAIDPGRLFNRKLGFSNINGFSNLFFAYSLISRWFFREGVDEEIGLGIFDDFVSQADVSTVCDMKRLNSYVSPLYLQFTKLRGRLGNIGNKVLWIDQFSKKNYKKIESILNSR